MRSPWLIGLVLWPLGAVAQSGSPQELVTHGFDSSRQAGQSRSSTWSAAEVTGTVSEVGPDRITIRPGGEQAATTLSVSGRTLIRVENVAFNSLSRADLRPGDTVRASFEPSSGTPAAIALEGNRTHLQAHNRNAMTSGHTGTPGPAGSDNPPPQGITEGRPAW
jgi:hypothetical protein